MADASARGWGPGWPTDRRKDMAWVTVRGVTCPAGVHKAIAPLVGWLLEETLRRGYELRPGWCWGYCNRPIRGTSVASNHSWGLAVDLNAPTNPMQSPLRTDMPTWMVQLWKNNGFAWGGDYTGRKDAMHFEFTGTSADAARITPKYRPPTSEVKIEGAGVTESSGEHIYVAWIGKGNTQTNEKGEIFNYQTPYFGGYNTLKPEQRQGTRRCVGIAHDPTNHPEGYRLFFNDGTMFVFPLEPIK